MSENIVNTTKKRGRPPGAIRDVFFILTALDSNKNLQQDMIKVTRTQGEKSSEEEMRTEAHQIFVSKYGLEPVTALGPFFQAKLTQSTTVKRETVKLSDEDVEYTNKKIKAEYNGWEVLGRHLNDINGNEIEDVVKISFLKEISPGSKKKAKPHDAFKQLSDLENIVEI